MLRRVVKGAFWQGAAYGLCRGVGAPEGILGIVNALHFGTMRRRGQMRWFDFVKTAAVFLAGRLFSLFGDARFGGKVWRGGEKRCQGTGILHLITVACRGLQRVYNYTLGIVVRAGGIMERGAGKVLAGLPAGGKGVTLPAPHACTKTGGAADTCTNLKTIPYLYQVGWRTGYLYQDRAGR